MSDPETHKRLVQKVGQAPDLRWAETFFDAAEELLEVVGHNADDPRLALTVPATKAALPISINQRYALTAFHANRYAIGFIVGSDYVRHSDILKQAINHIAFSSPRSGYEGEPFYVEFDDVDCLHTIDGLRYAWLAAARHEMLRGTRSSHRRFHQHAFYEAIINSTYRRQVLLEAFGK